MSNGSFHIEAQGLGGWPTANTAMPAYIELSPDGQLLALTVHRGQQDPLYGLANQGAELLLYQLNAADYKFAPVSSFSLDGQQMVNSTAWDAGGQYLYYTNTTISSAYKLHRIDTKAPMPSLYSYAHDLPLRGALQRGAEGNIYLAMARTSALAQVHASHINFDALNLGGDALGGALPSAPHRVTSAAQVATYLYARNLGRKQYELTDHLGNVRATLSDRLYATTTGTATTYHPELLSTNTYYPFGMGIRALSVQGGYRFGFNGMEKDDEINGSTGTSYTTEFRQYDPRIGRWLSIDKLTGKYSWLSPYASFNNNPIYFIDPSGLEGTEPEKKGDTFTGDDGKKYTVSFDGVVVSGKTPSKPNNSSSTKNQYIPTELKIFVGMGSSGAGFWGGYGWARLSIQPERNGKLSGYWESELIGDLKGFQITTIGVELLSASAGTLKLNPKYVNEMKTNSLTSILNRASIVQMSSPQYGAKYTSIKGLGLTSDDIVWEMNLFGFGFGTGYGWSSSANIDWSKEVKMTKQDSLQQAVDNVELFQGEFLEFLKNNGK